MRIDIIEKKEEILKMVKENKSKSEICRYLQCKQETLNRYLMDWEIKYSGNKGRKGFTHLEQRRNIYHYLNNEIFITTHNLKNKLLQEELKEHRCESCGLTEWMGGKIPIELHHIDGDKYNNNLKNLQILCPNCHSNTDNNSGKGTFKLSIDQKDKAKIYRKKKSIRKKLKTKYCKCGTLIDKRSKSCRLCKTSQKISNRPSLEILTIEVNLNGYCATGRKYGVSDNAVRKWIKSYQKKLLI
jgi:transposase-like protein/Zn finger protein HypA/HybF involved in hydrogenase expression